MSLALLFGLLVGGAAGTRGGIAESILMRFTDAALAVPVLFIVITLLAITGPSVPMLILAIGITSWMGLARLVRGELLVLRSRPYVEAAIAMGAPALHTATRHLLPHLVPSLVVFSTLGVGTAILTESALSFLGLGVQPPAASWGNMLSGAQSYVFNYPWLAAFPGLLILVTIVSVNLLGEALRDALEDKPENR
jgi:peptide/nickel transport system permease protein